jgi:hypothetical protein
MAEEKIDFIKVVDYLFINKDKYLKLSDTDKENNFFIINRKFSAQYPKEANFFNTKLGNRASALDIWFKIFKKTTSIPYWYWTKVEKKESKKFTKGDIDLFLKYNQAINPKYLDFIIDFYEEDMREEIKKLKKYETR